VPPGLDSKPVKAIQEAMMKSYAVWFKRVVWGGILVNFTFAAFAVAVPGALISTLHLGPVEPPVWLFNYAVLLALLSCFYIPAAHQPQRYIVNAWLLVAARLIPALIFFIGVAIAAMPRGFFTLGLGDLAIGVAEAVLLVLTLRAKSQATPDPVQ
jgi:hypothetical protein